MHINMGNGSTMTKYDNETVGQFEIRVFSRYLYTQTTTWPTTPEGWCAYYQHLDKVYNANEHPYYKRIAKSSPLHHDNRCSRCNGPFRPNENEV